MIFQNCPKYHEPRSGERSLEHFETLRAGIIAKHYVQVMLLFVYNIEAEKFSVTHKRSFFFTVEKTNKHRRRNVRNNLFTSMEEMIDNLFVKPVQTIQGKQHEIVQ